MIVNSSSHCFSRKFQHRCISTSRQILHVVCTSTWLLAPFTQHFCNNCTMDDLRIYSVHCESIGNQVNSHNVMMKQTTIGFATFSCVRVLLCQVTLWSKSSYLRQSESSARHPLGCFAWKFTRVNYYNLIVALFPLQSSITHFSIVLFTSITLFHFTHSSKFICMPFSGIYNYKQEAMSYKLAESLCVQVCGHLCCGVIPNARMLTGSRDFSSIELDTSPQKSVCHKVCHKYVSVIIMAVCQF